MEQGRRVSELWEDRPRQLKSKSRGVAQLVARLLWEHVRTGAKTEYRGVAQLVARLLWEQDAGSSSLPTPTKKPPIQAVFLCF